MCHHVLPLLQLLLTLLLHVLCPPLPFPKARCNQQSSCEYVCCTRELLPLLLLSGTATCRCGSAAANDTAAIAASPTLTAFGLLLLLCGCCCKYLQANTLVLHIHSLIIHSPIFIQLRLWPLCIGDGLELAAVYVDLLQAIHCNG